MADINWDTSIESRTKFSNEYWMDVLGPLKTYFEPCDITDHDKVRVENFLKKMKSEPLNDQINHAMKVANLITKPEKAYRRGKAYAMMNVDASVCEIYLNRAITLLGVDIIEEKVIYCDDCEWYDKDGNTPVCLAIITPENCGGGEFFYE